MPRVVRIRRSRAGRRSSGGLRGALRRVAGGRLGYAGPVIALAVLAAVHGWTHGWPTGDGDGIRIREFELPTVLDGMNERDSARREHAAGRAAVFAGRALAIDGDTIVIGPRRIRLAGIDAPEAGQSCQDARGRYDCGAAAKRALGALIGSQRVECRKQGYDAYRRTLAVCLVNGRDIGAAMVRAGWAVADRGQRGDYGELERQARAARQGIWAGPFEPPARWRREHRN